MGESQIDTSPVTGEPVPVSVYPGVEVYSGCVNDQGVLKLEVKKPLEESMVSRIMDSVENAAASKPKIDRFITKFARIYTPIVVLAAVLTAVVPLMTGRVEVLDLYGDYIPCYQLSMCIGIERSACVFLWNWSRF